MVSKLAISGIEGICYNGESHSLENSLVNILNVSFPCLTIGSLVTSLDKAGIAVSGGSACSNLSNGSSHVISALPCQKDKENVRFSFSKFNTFDEIDEIVKVIVKTYQTEPVSQARKGWQQIASWA
jgi:cysteine desulfurase